jgi:hypothetical protein
MATLKKIGIFPKPLVHNAEAAKLKHLMAVRGVDSVVAFVDERPTLIDVTSLELPVGSEPDYTVTAEFPAPDMFQLQAAPLATVEMEAIIKQLEWHSHESG